MSEQKQIKALIGAKQITQLTSLKPKAKKIVKLKVKRKSISELVQANFNNTEDNSKTAESSIQSVINSCHPDIKTLFNHNNIESYKVTATQLELKLNTGIRIIIEPNRTINFTQIFNNIRTKHNVHQTRYIIKDNKGKVIIDKKG